LNVKPQDNKSNMATVKSWVQNPAASRSSSSPQRADTNARPST
jgi:hypothetical protein